MLNSAVVLTHGAGGNCESKLLIAVDKALTDAGLTVRRFNLPFRERRSQGPPFPAEAATDREAIRQAVAAMKDAGYSRVIAAGHSYGGRQATMLASEDPKAVDGLLLLSYPLHPPRRPDQLRTGHLPSVQAPALFVHGTRDPFGSIDEMEAALQLVGGPTQLSVVEGAGHDLKSGKFDLVRSVVTPLLALK